jgi:hypothetical protein
MASWRIAPVFVHDQAEPPSAGGELPPPTERADLSLVAGFGTGNSALAPFEAPRKSRRASPHAARSRRLGELLLEAGLITHETLADALTEQRRTRPKRPLGEILLRSKLVPGAVLVRFLSNQCELVLEQETGFGTGLREAIENRHRNETQSAPLTPAADAESATHAEVPTVPTDVPSGAAPARPPRRLGELLIEAGVLTGPQLDEALAEQEDSGRMLGEILVDRGHVPMITLVNLLSEQLHGRLEQSHGFGTGLRHTIEEKLLDRDPSPSAA